MWLRSAFVRGMPTIRQAWGRRSLSKTQSIYTSMQVVRARREDDRRLGGSHLHPFDLSRSVHPSAAAPIIEESRAGSQWPRCGETYSIHRLNMLLSLDLMMESQHHSKVEAGALRSFLVGSSQSPHAQQFAGSLSHLQILPPLKLSLGGWLGPRWLLLRASVATRLETPPCSWRLALTPIQWPGTEDYLTV